MSLKPPDTSNEKEAKKQPITASLTLQYNAEKKANQEFVKEILKLSQEPKGGPSPKKPR